MKRLPPHVSRRKTEVASTEGSNTIVAARVMDKFSTTSKGKDKTNSMREKIDQFIQECNLMCHLRHPHIVLFMGGHLDSDEPFIVTEFCPGYSNVLEFKSITLV